MTIDRRDFLVSAAGAVAGLTMLHTPTRASLLRLKDPIGVAVIGTGRQGIAILGELLKYPAVNVQGICDVDPGRLRSGQRRASAAEGFEDYRAMLDKLKGVSAVFVATPTHLHKEIVLDLIARGKHVYCETPLAHTIEDSKAMVDAARGAKIIVQPALEGRSNPIYKLARTFYRSDSVRDAVSMRAQSYQKTTWRSPAGSPDRERALNWRLDPELSLGLAGEMGTSQFDVIHFFTDKYPVSVAGGGAVRFHQDGRAIFDTINCGFEFPNQTHLSYEASLANSYEGRYEVLRGSNAAIKLAWTAAWMFKEADAPTQGWEVYANRQQFHNDEGITLIADATKLASQGKLKEGVGLPNPPTYYSVGDFIASIADGKPPVAAIDEGHRATVVGIRANEAVVTGNRVSISVD